MLMEKILVPTDFSDPSLHALDAASAMARSLGGRIHLIHVLDDYATLSSGAEFGLSVERYEQQLAEEAQAELKRIARRYPNLEFTSVVRRGKPAAEILAYAELIGADLIVIATHGRSGLARLFLGSTTEEVVRQAPCPVMSVRRASTPLETVAQATAGENPML